MPATATEPATDNKPAISRRLTFWYWLAAICASGFLFRLWIVLFQRPTADSRGGSVFVLEADAIYYYWQGRAIGEGLGFINPYAWQLTGETEPSAVHVPLYSAFLGVVSWFGAHSVTAHRIASSVLGVIGIALIALVARRLAGNRAALLAAGIAALYPQLWINDGMLLAEPMSVVTIGITLLAAYRLWDRRDLVSAGLLGGAIGLATLARAEQLALFVVLVLPLVYWLTADWKRRFQTVGIVALVGGLVLAPWLLFTTTSFERPVLLTTATGSVLSAGSCDDAFYGQYIGYYANCFVGTAEGDETEMDAVARDQALDYLEDHTVRLPIVVAARVGRVWGLFKPGQTTALDWSIEGRGRGASWIGLFAYYVLAPLAIGGLVVLRRRRVLIWPLVSLPIVVTMAAITSFGVTRYRAPAEAVIVIGAAVALDALWRWLAARRQSPATPEPAPEPVEPNRSTSQARSPATAVGEAAADEAP